MTKWLRTDELWCPGRFEDDNHITETWTWREGGKDTPMVFHFSRKKN